MASFHPCPYCGLRPSYVCTREAARMLAISPYQVRNLARRNAVWNQKISFGYVFRTEDILELSRQKELPG